MVPNMRIPTIFSTAMRICLILLILLSAAASIRCQSIRYYAQAIDGQMDILKSRRPISGLVEDPATPPDLRRKLVFISSVRDFAEKDLRLPVDDHYLSYVELDRPYVVWNVFAAPEFSLRPRTWCFPVAGCVAYRGYFSAQDAEGCAEELKAEGYDVYIRGAIAYSTLGWFDDPVLSTFLNMSEPQTAALIFHELAHALLYVAGDTAFNEGFATAVEQEGFRRWLAAANNLQAHEKWLARQRQRQKFTELVSKYRTRLQDLYDGSLPLNEKRDRKAALFAQMRSEFTDLKSNPGEMAVYDHWFGNRLNNAQLISVSTYYDWVPAFNRILSESGGDLQKFYRKCGKLAKKKSAERNRILENCAARGETGSACFAAD